MNAKSLVAFLAALSFSGCIVVSGGGGGNPPPTKPNPGNVTLTWSFVGGTCADFPDVKNVQVTIPGETLQNGGIYPCLANNYPGIELHDFAGGDYTYTVEAVDYGNHVIFTGAGSFSVNGNVREDIDLTPVGGATSYAQVRWFFPPLANTNSPSCAQTAVATVDMFIDDVASGTFNCAAGQTAAGQVTPYLNPGNHSLVLVAYDQFGYELYRKVSTLPTQAGKPYGVDYVLDWSVGGAAVGWQFSVGGVLQSCAQVGVTTVYVNFKDSAGNFVYDGKGDPQNCTASPALYNYLHGGNYTVWVEGTNGNGSKTYYSTNSPPVTPVINGQFKDATMANVYTLE